MVEPAYGLNKDFGTMTALASTIMPVSDDSDLFPLLKKSRSKSSTAMTHSRTYEDDFRDGLRIPLPPSSTSSQSEQGPPVGTGDAQRTSQNENTKRLGNRAGESSMPMSKDTEGLEQRTQNDDWREEVAASEKWEDKRMLEESGEKKSISKSTSAEQVDAQQPANTSARKQPQHQDLECQDLGPRSGKSITPKEVLSGEAHENPPETNVAGQAEKEVMEKSIEGLDDKPPEELTNNSMKGPLEIALEGPSQVWETVSPDVPVVVQESHQRSVQSHSAISLQEVVAIVRKRDYDQHCLKAMQNEVQELTRRCATFQRRICLQAHLYGLMLHHFRTENRGDFSSTYQQSVQARDSYTDTLGPPDVSKNGLERDPHTLQDQWVSKLSPTSSKSVVQLLHHIREVPSFLPDCLVNLSSFQLESLSQKSSLPSAAPSPQHGGSIFSRSLDWNRHAAGPFSDTKPKAEDVRHSPLALLVYGAFDTPCSSGCREGHLRRERLVDSCARLISSGKKGSNDFVLSILATSVESSPWQSKVQLEQYMTQLIQDGDFVLESSEHQHMDFSEAAPVTNARNAVATAEFYDRGLRTLLNLLTKGSTCNVIPDGLLDFVRAVLSKIADSKQRSKARDFFVSRWYCSAFLSKALMYPETHGMMMQHYLSSAARQKILLEMARRLQQSVAETLSSRYQGLPPSEEVHRGILKLVTFFEPTLESQTVPDVASISCVGGLDNHHLMLRPQEFLDIARAFLPGLSPHGQPSLNPNEGNLGRSSTSSGTGSSTLTAATAEQRTGTASSMAPSFSWTSIASMTTNSEAILSRPVEVIEHTDSSSTLVPDTKAISAEGLEQPLDRRLTQVVNEVEFMLARIAGGHQDGTQSLEDAFSCFRVSSIDGSLSAGHLVGDHLSGLQADRMDANASQSRRDRHDIGAIREALLRSCREYPGSLTGHRLSSDVRGELSSYERVAACFETNMTISDGCQDFQSFHYWWQSLQTLRRLPMDAQDTLVSGLLESLRNELDAMDNAFRLCNAWMFSLRGRFKVRVDEKRSIERQCDALRAKMWYNTDAKHSSAYEEALIVTKALRSMARPPPPRFTGVAAWARHRLKTSIGSERAQTQILEALSADPNHGGPGKLSDSQAERTSKWLIEQNVENLCKGEERLHRFCLEIRKTANRLVGENMGKSPALWASTLFQTESRLYKTEGMQGAKQESSTAGNQNSDMRSVATMPKPNYPIRSFQAEMRSHAGLFSSSVPTYDGPLKSAVGPLVQSVGPSFQHPFPSKSTLFSSDSLQPQGESVFQSVSNHVALSSDAHNGIQGSAKKVFLTNLKETVVSLLLSDLGSLLWNRGSETDRWISDEKLLQQVHRSATTTGQEQSSADPISKVVSSAPDQPKGESRPPTESSSTIPIKTSNLFTPASVLASPFPFQQAYETILRTFTLHSNPYRKIKLLYDLTVLATHSIRESRQSVQLASFQSPPSTIPTVRKPRTKTTRLEEVIANVEERRGSISAARPPVPFPANLEVFSAANPDAAPSDADIASVLKPLLSDRKTRPKTLFRDLQYIAALIPTSYLDSTPEGKAFWTIGLIALGLKADLCTEMVKRAGKIVIEYFEKPGGGGLASTGRDASGSLATAVDGSDGDASGTGQPGDHDAVDLHAAARMYTLAALEGDPVAARELALFYFIHPELVPTVTLPLSRPSDVFRLSNGNNGDKAASGSGGGGGAGMTASPLVGGGEASGGGGGGGAKDKGKIGEKGKGGGGGGEKGGLDPRNFALAWHWMEVAANGGDRDAVQFLRENGELGKGF